MRGDEMSEQLLREILAEVKDIKKKIEFIEVRMSRMETRMDFMESTIAEHSGLLHELEHRMEENTAQLTSIAEDIHYIKGDIAKLHEENKKRGIVIDMIAIKLTQQEAEIWDLKKTVYLSQELDQSGGASTANES